METTTEDQLRTASLKWWVNLGADKANALRLKYFPERALLNAEERLAIYVAEHPHTEGKICWDCKGEIKDGICFCNREPEAKKEEWREEFEAAAGATIEEVDKIDWDLYPGNEAGAFDHLDEQLNDKFDELLDREVEELENDLYNQPTGAPPKKEDSSLLNGITQGEWKRRDKAHEVDMGDIFWSCEVSNGKDIPGVCYGDTKEEAEANAELFASCPRIVKENERLSSSNRELMEALKIAHQYMTVFMIRGEEPLVGENLKTDLYKVLSLIEANK